MFLDDHWFSNQSDDYDHVVHGVVGGPILQKLWHPQSDVNAPIDPLYHLPLIVEIYEAKMHKDVKLLHLEPTL